MKTPLPRTAKLFWILTPAFLAVLLSQNVYALTASLQQIQGEVLVHKISGEANTWNAVTEDTTLENGDSLKTQKGTCALVYGDQAVFSVDENTSITVEDKADAQDIRLLLGKIKGKVNKQKAEQPFQVVTPAAVATVRGTEVDFTFNNEGLFTVDLHHGKIEIVNDDAALKLDIDGKKSIFVKFNKEANIIYVKNGCGSDSVVKFSVLGTEYAEAPCEEKEVTLSTSAEGDNIPGTPNPKTTENIQEGREPISEITSS